MASTADSSGVVFDKYADIIAAQIAAAILQWGESVDTSEEEYLGHKLRLISTMQGDSNDISQTLYDALSIANSSGAKLANLVAIVGLTRQKATKSTAVLSLTATQACTVPVGAQYKTAANVIFETTEEQVFTGAGTADVNAQCTVTGANEAGAGEINLISTTIFGISGVTNSVAATPGQARETDQELKEAHTLATETSGDDDVGSIYEALRKVTNNSSALVEENDEDYAVNDIPAHSLRISVIGGTDEDIATAINNNRTSTIPTVGTTTTTVYNTNTGQSKDIKFSRAADKRHYLDATITTTGLFPDDGLTQINTALTTHFANFRIGDDTDYNGLFAPFYSVPGVIVTALTVGTNPSPTGTVTIVNSHLERAALDVDNDVNITVS